MMADARQVEVWSLHSVEQMAQKAYQAPKDGYHGDLLAHVLAAEPWEMALDFGCGTGLWRDFFRPGAYVGLDQNPDMIAGARTRWGDDGDFVLCSGIADGAQMPFADGTFDVVFTSAVLQHNTDSDKTKILSEIRRALRTGGRYLAYENTWEGVAVDATDGYSHTREGWRVLLAPYGFVLEGGQRDFYIFRAR